MSWRAPGGRGQGRWSRRLAAWLIRTTRPARLVTTRPSGTDLRMASIFSFAVSASASALLQSLLRFFALGDVPGQTEDRRLSQQIDPAAADLDRQERAVLAPLNRLQHGAAVPHDLVNVFPDPFTFGRRVNVVLGQVQQLLPFIPEVDGRLPVGFQHSAVRGHENDGIQGTVENGPEFPFRLFQLTAGFQTPQMLGCQLLQQLGISRVKTQNLLNSGTVENRHLLDRLQVRSLIKAEFPGLAPEMFEIGRSVEELGDEEGSQPLTLDDDGKADMGQAVPAPGFEIVAGDGWTPIAGEGGKIGVAFDAALHGKRTTAMIQGADSLPARGEQNFSLRVDDGHGQTGGDGKGLHQRLDNGEVDQLHKGRHHGGSLPPYRSLRGLNFSLFLTAAVARIYLQDGRYQPARSCLSPLCARSPASLPYLSVFSRIPVSCGPAPAPV